MKMFITFLIALSLAFSPVFAMADGAQSVEIKALNSLPGSKSLLNLSGGRSCSQYCDPCGYMDQQVCCHTNCTDDDNSGSSGSNVAAGEITIGGAVLLILVCIWLYHEMTTT